MVDRYDRAVCEGMNQTTNGEYVEYDDYADLQAKHDVLRREAKKLCMYLTPYMKSVQNWVEDEVYREKVLRFKKSTEKLL